MALSASRSLRWRTGARRFVPALIALFAALPALAQPLGSGGGLGVGVGGGWGNGLGRGLDGLQRQVEVPLVREQRDASARAQRLDVPALAQQRRAALDALLQREPQRLERTPDGEVVVRGELLVESPSPALLAAARAAGFRIEHDASVDALGLSMAVLHAPSGWSSAQALARLRKLGAAGAEDLDPLYLPAVSAVTDDDPAGSRSLPGPPGSRAAMATARNNASGRVATRVRIGLVDGGVDVRHPALRRASIELNAVARGCSSGSRPDRHGTAVASLLVGRDGAFRGAAPGAQLLAADIYCGDPANGSAEAVVRALAWLAAQRVPVINLSIVGPPNRLLEKVVAALVQRGHLLVAAVGNDGPAAAPLYPAGYRGVVGVTGVNPQGRVLPEALQGPQVAFAAPGAVLAAADGDGYRAQRGTSFAAPFVAGLLAQRLDTPDPVLAAQARASLAGEAIDLGATGRDPVYGDGWVARELRVDPAQL